MVPDVCVPAWFGVVCAVVIVVALALLVRSWLRRRQERHERRVRERTQLSAGDWINLGLLLLGVAGAVASIVHCPDHPPDVGISLTDSRLDPAGYDDPSDEYVCLINSDDQPVSLAGWELRGAERRVNVLPSFTLKPGAAVRVHPGEGANSAHDLYGEEGSPQWRNEGGQISLFDSEGQEVDSVGYGERKDDDGSGECGSKVATPTTTGETTRETTTGGTTTAETTTEEPPPACDPSYQGACLDPEAVDYDCAGGEGDGPEYVEGPIAVVGEDRFDLDSDGNGTACEP